MTYASDIQTVGVSFVLVTGLLYLVCKFLVIASGAVLGILSGIVFLASLVLFFTAGVWAGLAWLVIAFLISPYGLPMAAAWLVGMIGGANHALKDFVFG
ncbi:MAG: CD1845 family protein [[Eubacterium] siraeum]